MHNAEIVLETIAPTTSRVGHWPLRRSIIRYRARNKRIASVISPKARFNGLSASQSINILDTWPV